MDENVTYKALVYILLGSIAALFAFGQNASAKFNQVDKNEKQITAINNEIKKTNETIQDNQIEVIKGLSRIELLFEAHKNKN